MIGDELQDADPDLPLTWQHTDLDSFMRDAALCHMDQLTYPKLCEEIYSSHLVDNVRAITSSKYFFKAIWQDL